MITPETLSWLILTGMLTIGLGCTINALIKERNDNKNHINTFKMLYTTKFIEMSINLLHNSSNSEEFEKTMEPINKLIHSIGLNQQILNALDKRIANPKPYGHIKDVFIEIKKQLY